MPNKDPEIRRRVWREWYHRNKSTHYQKLKKQSDIRDARLREWFKSRKSSLHCVRCGFDHIAALQFHHRDPSDKDLAVAEAVKRGWSISRIEKEIAKCDVLCANCHAIEHHAHRFVVEGDDMLYTRRTFTCPAASGKVTDTTWDRAFLTKEQFESKHGAGSFDEAVPSGTDNY